MESKHKNALIGALLAVVFVMAVGYAAFAQTLTITGTATIESTWDVHFDTEKTTDIQYETGAGGTVQPQGTVSFTPGNEYSATINATLNQPGDKVTFTLTIMNEGTIAADLGTPVLSLNGGGSDSNPDDLIIQEGNIIFTVTNPTPATINDGQTATMTVTAEFDENAQSVGDTTTSSITVTTKATQA